MGLPKGCKKGHFWTPPGGSKNPPLEGSKRGGVPPPFRKKGRKWAIFPSPKVSPHLKFRFLGPKKVQRYGEIFENAKKLGLARFRTPKTGKSLGFQVPDPPKKGPQRKISLKNWKKPLFWPLFFKTWLKPYSSGLKGVQKRAILTPFLTPPGPGSQGGSKKGGFGGSKRALFGPFFDTPKTPPFTIAKKGCSGSKKSIFCNLFRFEKRNLWFYDLLWTIFEDLLVTFSMLRRNLWKVIQ